MRRFRRTSLITAGCVAALVGLALSRKLAFQPSWWLALFSPILLLLIRKNLLSLSLVIILGVLIGLSRGSLYMHNLNDIKALASHKVTITTTAKTDAVYGKRSQIEFIGSNIRLQKPQPKEIAGSFKLSGFGVPMVYRGDQVEVSGKLYPMRGSNQARIAYAKLRVIATGKQWYDKLTRNFATGMENALPEPQASFSLGLLVGQRTNLPAQVVTQLTMVGLVHIVAVSGYNLTILVRASQRLRLNSKFQKTALAIALIVTFVLMTGFSASIVRAAIVSLLGLWAWYYGRDLKPLVLLSFTAALTALYNPFYIWSDLGWYLSFLAFFGVLVIAPLITNRLFSRQPQVLTFVLIETLSAELMTLPLIMMTFGQLSAVALLANLLIVPLVPVAMLLSAIAGAAGALTPQVAGWLAWPAKLLLTYMLDFISLLATIPSAMLHVKISPAAMVGIYIVVIMGILMMYRSVRARQRQAVQEAAAFN